MKKYSYLIRTLIENISIAPLVLESLEMIIDSPEEVEQIIDDSTAMIECVQSISSDTFFQGISNDVQTEITEVANFISEAAREKDYLMSNRLTIPQNMMVKPELVTIDSLAKIFEIALCRFLTFTKIYYTYLKIEHADDFATLDQEKLDDMEKIIKEIDEADILIEREQEYRKLSFEKYVNVKFVSYEDDLKAAVIEAAMDGASEEEIEAAKNVAVSQDFVFEWE